MKKRELLFKNFVTERDNKFQSFMMKSRLTILVCIEIGSRSKDDAITFELLCAEIPKYIGSRSSVLSVLSEGVESGFFEKTRSSEDKRLRQYQLSEGVKDWYFQLMKKVDDEYSKNNERNEKRI